MPSEMRADIVGGRLPTPRVLPVVVPHCARASAKPLRDVLLRQSRLIQFNEARGLISAEAWISYPLASLPDHPKNCTLGEAVSATKINSGCTGSVISNHALAHLSL
jgi:hypothetical protein